MGGSVSNISRSLSSDGSWRFVDEGFLDCREGLSGVFVSFVSSSLDSSSITALLPRRGVARELRLFGSVLPSRRVLLGDFECVEDDDFRDFRGGGLAGLSLLSSSRREMCRRFLTEVDPVSSSSVRACSRREESWSRCASSSAFLARSNFSLRSFSAFAAFSAASLCRSWITVGKYSLERLKSERPSSSSSLAFSAGFRTVRLKRSFFLGCVEGGCGSSIVGDRNVAW